MTLGASLEGGCACGAIRYRLGARPFDAGYCHCRICQQTSGAPVMAFATAHKEHFIMLGDEPGRRRSSDLGERWFCRDCGSPIAMCVDHQPDTIDFAIATLDDPELVAPGFHIWTRSRIGWFDTNDSLERHERFRPDTVGLDRGVAGSAQPHESVKEDDMNAPEPRPSKSPPRQDDAAKNDALKKARPDAATRVEKGDPRPKDVNPLAPPVNIEAGS